MDIPAVVHKGPTQQKHLFLGPAATERIDNMENSTGHFAANPCNGRKMKADSEKHLIIVGRTPE
jgi:hypothetical protein